MTCSIGAHQPCSDRTDLRFVKVEEQIHEVLNQALSTRSVELKVARVCEAAKISRPTFYAHCNNGNDAMRRYEATLQEMFQQRLPKVKCQKDVVYTILLSFIYDQQRYFASTIPNANYWLLKTLFQEMRPRLATNTITDRTYCFYAQTQIIIINDWVEYDQFAKQRIPFYVQKLTRTRLIDPAL